MRSLFILLLVINISYLVWGVAFSEKNITQTTMPLPKTAQSLTLLSEHQAAMVVSTAAENTNSQSPSESFTISKSETDLGKQLPPSMAPAKTCYSLGPILNEEDSKKLEEKLKQNGFEVKHKAITDKEPKSYWVYFPAEKSLQDAKAVVKQLEIANVKDYFIIRKGNYAYAISLGLYNGYSRAKIRVRALKKLGFDPKVQTRYKNVTRHWLDFQETDTKRVQSSLWDSMQQDNPLQKLARPCANLAANKS